jgi:hypothetical protein
LEYAPARDGTVSIAATGLKVGSRSLERLLLIVQAKLTGIRWLVCDRARAATNSRAPRLT